LAKTMTRARRDQFLQGACDKYEAAVKWKADKFGALSNWGNVLADLAEGERGTRREQLFQDACAKYEAAVEVAPDSHEALFNWGITLSTRARATTEVEQEQLFREACTKYEAALKVKPDYYIALDSWGTALLALAEAKVDREREELLTDACTKYEATVEVNPDFHPSYNNWGAALSALAKTKSAGKRADLLTHAVAHVVRAVEMADQTQSKDSAARYVAHLVRLTLLQCSDAVHADNMGEARLHFVQALDNVRRADPRRGVDEFVGFFNRVACRTTASHCQEFLQEIRSHDMNELANILEPFAHAVDYWLCERDPDHVLDRLNPEVREIVEAIIHRGEGEPPSDR